MRQQILLRNKLLPLLSLFLLLALPTAVKATHIVGGDISYKCLGNNEFEITLSLYRDCFFGASDAPFDDPAFVNVFDENGTIVRELEIPFMVDDTLDAVLFDECLFVPENVCVHTTFYRDTVSLPFMPGGYDIVYQRCCRNETIVNIINPRATGATYTININEEALMQCNNSPNFKEWPPIFICVNKPIFFDHSAVDLDGDSLVYKLCTPYTGASLREPKPKPSPPPFDTVVWLNPTYSVDNMLGGNDPLTINPTTGLLTGLPTIQGQFVVGVCVEEYDRETGKLLSLTRRDFQYNVGQCGTVVSNFSAPDAQCEDLSVSFLNDSDNADEFVWYFDYPNNLGFTSTEANPTVTYPDTGRYTIALIAEPNSVCADTSFQEVFLQDNSLSVDFQIDVFDCQDSAVIEITNLTSDPFSPIISWEWLVDYGTDTITASIENPMFTVPLNVVGAISLTATTQNGCIKTLKQNFESGLDNPVAFIEDIIIACEGDTVSINPNTDPNIAFLYEWEGPGIVGDRNVVNPTVVALGTQSYSVTITPTEQVCEIITNVTVSAVAQPAPMFEANIQCDGLTVEFENTTVNADNYRWTFGDPNNPDFISTEANPNYIFPEAGTYTVTLLAGNDGLCFQSFTQELVLSNVDLDAAFDVEYLNCEPGQTIVKFTDQSTNTANNTASWLWELSDGRTFDTPDITVPFSSSQTLTVTLTIADPFGCSNAMTTESIFISVLPELELLPPSEINLCAGDSSIINLPAGYGYEWAPSSGITAIDDDSFIVKPDMSSLYTLTISNYGIDTCTYDYSVAVIVADDINLQINGPSVTCNANETLTATTNVPATITWMQGSGAVLQRDENTTTSSYNTFISGTPIFIIRAETPNGCVEEIQYQISGGPVDVRVPDDVAVCLGEEVNISITNLDPNDNLSYTWTPANAFVDGTENDPIPDYIEAIGEQTVYVTIENEFGCSVEDSILVTVVDPNLQLGFTFEVQCDGATVEFTNTSTGISNFIWDFGDGTTSTEANPIHTYPGAGDFTVTLSIPYNVSCRQTSSQVINIIDPQIIADFDFDLTDCSNGAGNLALFDQSINTFNNTVGWSWVINGNEVSTEQNPIVTLDESGEYIVSLTITSANDCSATKTDTLNFNFVEVNLADTLLLCAGDSIPLNPNGNTSYEYNWVPGNSLDDPTSADPIAFPTVTTTYFVTVSGIGSDTCQVQDQITVVVSEPIDIALPDTIRVCPGEQVALNPGGDENYEYNWTPSTGLSTANSANPTFVGSTTTTFIVTVSDDEIGVNCQTTDTVTVVVNPAIELQTMGDTTLCEIAEIQLSATTSTNATIQWFDDAALTNVIGTGNTITVLPVQGANDYYAKATDSFGCMDTSSVIINVTDFQSGLANTIDVCGNTPTPLNPNGNPAYEYTWTPTDSLDLTEPWNPIVTTSTNQTYVVSVIDPASGCSSIDTVQVNVYPLIELETMNDTLICEIAPINLTATTAVNATINWYDDPAFTNLIGTGSSITVTPSVGTNTYYVIASDSFGCMDTSSVVVTAADFQTGLQDEIDICGNTPTPLNPNGNPAYEYTWTPTDSLDLTNPWNPIVTTSTDQTYIVSVVDPASGCSSVDTIQVNVYPLIELQTMNDTLICEVGPVELSASTAVNATINWYDDPAFANLIGTGGSITVTPNEGTNIYFVIASDSNGCQDTSQVTVNIGDFQTGLQEEIDICGNTPTPLNPNGNPDFEYTWMPTDSLDLTNPWNPIITSSTDQTYIVTVVDPVSGCSTMDTVQVNVYPLLNLEAEGDTLLCEITPVNLTATTDVPGATISWYNEDLSTLLGSGSPFEVTPTEGTNIYVAIASDANGCTDTSQVTVQVMIIETGLPRNISVCANEPVQLNPNGNPAFTYDWEPETGLDLPDTPNPTITVDQDITYIVTVTDPTVGCTVIDTVDVSVFPIYTVQAERDTMICSPTPLIFTAISDAPNPSFIWSDQRDFSNVLGTMSTLSITANETTTYYVQLTDGNSCSNIDSVQVTLMPVLASLDPEIFLCEPLDQTTLEVINLDPNQTLTFEWSPTNAIIGSNTEASVTVDPNEEENYSVIVTNQNGCQIELSTVVRTFNLAGTLRAAADPNVIFIGESSQLEVTGCDECEFIWDPSGSLDAPDIQNPIATPEETTTYTVTATVGPCIETAQVTVEVRDICGDPIIFLPNAFTPNGDGENDMLMLRGDFIEEMHLMVYNRWGQLVFETRDKFAGWDGTFRGEQLPPDVYGFHLQVICPGGNEFNKKGSISLLR